jgi:hypothetical protein
MRFSIHRVFALCGFLTLGATPTFAQHDHHQHMTAEEKPAGPVLFNSDMKPMTGMVPVDPMGDKIPGWSWMTMGVVRFGYNHQGGPSGDEGFESTNWFMWMGHHDLGPGRFTMMMMNSLEAATLDDPGSPELFQTGETFEGEPIVDYQHPHDLFMNLSVTYRASLSPRSALWLQVAPVGEPALGPTAFMHRTSSGENPTAPLSHHWQDATHITDNVVTVGGGWNRVSLEGSGFHGQEPDENRWDIDWGPIDSYSGRLSLGLPKKWSAQVSYGNLHDVETTMPGDIQRTTASLHYGMDNSANALSLVFGQNREDHGTSNSFLAEYAHQLDRHHVYSRFEWVQKDEILLATKDHEDHSHGHPMPLVDVSALTVGYFHTGRIFGGLGLGGDVTFYLVPSSLETVYDDFPVSIHVFMRARWATGAHHH